MNDFTARGHASCLFFVLLVAASACEGGESGAASAADTPPRDVARPTVSDSGRHVVFPLGSEMLQRFGLDTLRAGVVPVEMLAPARVTVVIGASTARGERALLFETPDATTLWSQFRQAQATARHADTVLARVRGMFADQGATARDLADAENDAAVAHATGTEMDGRLRQLGYEPSALTDAPPGTAWLQCDVAEAMLSEVEPGETVRVVLAARPDVPLTGRAVSIVAAVDPVTRTAKVRVVVPNAGGWLLPGMFARVDFGDPRPGALAVPAAALVAVEGRTFAFVQVDARTFERREVLVDELPGGRAIVRRGLRAGDAVVSDGAMLLKGLSFGY